MVGRRRGPAPKPPEQLSSWRAKERAKRAVEAQRKRPSAPRWLDRRALAIWKRLVPRLEFMGILRLVDEEAIARYCQLSAMYLDCITALKKGGRTYQHEDREGNVIRRFHAEVKLMLDLDARMARFERDFGMTPTARAGLVVTHREPGAAEVREGGTDTKDEFFTAG